MGSIFSVVVNDLHLLRSGVGPHEADAPLVVDPDAVLTGSITLERFEPVAGRNAEVLQDLSGPHLTKLAQRHPEDPRVQGRHSLTMPQPLGVLATERSDHVTSI